MNFEQALKALRDGKRITRAAWNDNECITLINGRLVDQGGIVVLALVPFELLAEDWEIVESKVSITSSAFDEAVTKTLSALLKLDLRTVYGGYSYDEFSFIIGNLKETLGLNKP